MIPSKKFSCLGAFYLLLSISSLFRILLDSFIVFYVLLLLSTQNTLVSLLSFFFRILLFMLFVKFLLLFMLPESLVPNIKSTIPCVKSLATTSCFLPSSTQSKRASREGDCFFLVQEWYRVFIFWWNYTYLSYWSLSYFIFCSRETNFLALESWESSIICSWIYCCCLALVSWTSPWIFFAYCVTC